MALRAAALLLLALAFAVPAAQARPDAYWTLKLGQGMTQRGGEGGLLRVTLLGVVDPARSPLYRPRRGTRFVAFRLRIANLSARRWQGTVASWAELVDADGFAHDVTSRLSGSPVQPWPVLVPAWNGGTTLHARETRVAYLGWVVRSDTRLAEFRYRLELGPDVAVWRLRR